MLFEFFFVKTYGHAMRIKTVWLATVRPQNGSSGFHGKVGEVSISMRQWFLLAFWARSCKQHTCSLSHSCQLKPEVMGTSRPLCFIMRPTARRKQALVQNRFDFTSLAASRTKANACRVLRTRREGWFTMVPVRERYWPPSGFTNPSKMASANRWIMLWRSILRAHAAEDRFGELKQTVMILDQMREAEKAAPIGFSTLGPKKTKHHLVWMSQWFWNNDILLMYDRDRTYYPKTLPSKKQIMGGQYHEQCLLYTVWSGQYQGWFVHVCPHLLVKFPSTQKKTKYWCFLRLIPHTFFLFSHLRIALQDTGVQ